LKILILLRFPAACSFACFALPARVAPMTLGLVVRIHEIAALAARVI
jgi:hypothetical protein